MSNNIILLATIFVIAGLLIGGVIAVTLFPKVETKTVTITEPAKNCIPVACTPVSCTPVNCIPVKCIKAEDSITYDLSDAELKDQIMIDKNVSYVGIYRNSRTCEKFIEAEQEKGFIEDAVVPFCWNKDGKQNRTIVTSDDYSTGCRLAYILGC
jgi:hypothetical protein